MNTVASTEKPNSLEQDKQVNPQQSQFTSTRCRTEAIINFVCFTI